MRISTFWYCLKQGIKNICRNIWFSLASMATISACIFLFCLFFSVIANVQYMVKHVEGTVGITVLFDEGLGEDQIQEIGKTIGTRSEIREITYISAAQAWETFKKDYFAGNEALAEGFANDNPLAGSASYVIFLKNLDSQETLVSYLNELEGVRQVNYSNSVMAGFSSLNKVIGILSVVIIGVLLLVSVFLINNTISVAAAFRKNESQIMRLIGATNFMIRAPFIVEGVMIGMIGAAIPLSVMYFLYVNAVTYIIQKFRIFSSIIEFIPIARIYPQMVVVAMILGMGIGFFGSYFTIRKYLRV